MIWPVWFAEEGSFMCSTGSLNVTSKVSWAIMTRFKGRPVACACNNLNSSRRVCTVRARQGTMVLGGKVKRSTHNSLLLNPRSEFCTFLHLLPLIRPSECHSRLPRSNLVISRLFSLQGWSSGGGLSQGNLNEFGRIKQSEPGIWATTIILLLVQASYWINIFYDPTLMVRVLKWTKLTRVDSS